MDKDTPGGKTCPNLKTPKINPLLQFTLQGQSEELAKQAVEQKPLLGDICLAGQGTVICAPPNAGKTLITMSLIIEAVKSKRIDGNSTFYINADDTTAGLAEKSAILDEFGVHMLAQGHRGFHANKLSHTLEQMIDQNMARGTLLILDTFKKFVQLMSKQDTATFTDVVRRFVLKGGTLVCLSHTNKYPDKNGANMFAGVSDIIDDLDAVWVVNVEQGRDGSRIATFTNRKRRGNSPDEVAYVYNGDPEFTYEQRVLSVQTREIRDSGSTDFRDSKTSDEDILHDLALMIHHGNDVGKRLLDQYTGDDANIHRWKYVVRGRGRHAFELLGPLPEF